jgi:hypothetical protein
LLRVHWKHVFQPTFATQSGICLRVLRHNTFQRRACQVANLVTGYARFSTAHAGRIRAFCPGGDAHFKLSIGTGCDTCACQQLSFNARCHAGTGCTDNTSGSSYTTARPTKLFSIHGKGCGQRTHRLGARLRSRL